MALIISLVVVGLVRLIYRRDKINNFLKQILVIVFSFFLAVLCVFAVAGKTGVSQYFGHTTFTDTEEQGSVADRQSTISVAAEQSLKHPFGLGAGAFGALPEYKDDIASEGYQTVNNLYLEITVEEGFIGLILFLLFIWNYAISLIDPRVKPEDDGGRDRLWTTISIGLFLAILIQYLFFSTIYIIYIWAVLAILSPKTKELKNESY